MIRFIVFSHTQKTDRKNQIWIINTGCSNYLTKQWTNKKNLIIIQMCACSHLFIWPEQFFITFCLNGRGFLLNWKKIYYYFVFFFSFKKSTSLLSKNNKNPMNWMISTACIYSPMWHINVWQCWWHILIHDRFHCVEWSSKEKKRKEGKKNNIVNHYSKLKAY
mgnify:CR=1 FL=1